MGKAFAFGAVLALGLIALSFGCAQQQGNGQIVGGDKDEHGCIGSAGYSWCGAKQECLRTWEEECTAQGSGTEINNFEECVAAGNPVIESYPRKCSTGAKTFTEEIPAQALTEEEAREIAQNSSCIENGALKESAFRNDNTKTWWIDLEPAEAQGGCSPACVVSEESKTAETNWRCTGLVPE
ncbi:MAG: hypothetical protein V1676_04015 [Candidatus Diapherotrites archaeon]